MVRNKYQAKSLQEVREEILKRKAIQEQNKINIKRTIDRIRNSVNSLDKDTVTRLKDYGIHADLLVNVDFDRLLEDKSYLLSFITEVRRLTEQYKDVVGELLDN